MTTQPVTLHLPVPVYEQVQRAAAQVQRPVQDVLIEIVAAASPAGVALHHALSSALANMAYLNDASLWQAARATMLPEQREQLANLHDIQKRRPLTTEEQAEETALLQLYRETILVRAQAAVLLKLRGYDVSNPALFSPFV